MAPWLISRVDFDTKAKEVFHLLLRLLLNEEVTAPSIHFGTVTWA
jgi:hypothetical protein